MSTSQCMIVAELSANHNGDFDLARRTIEAAAHAGADAVKLQTYLPSSLTLPVDSPDFVIKGGLWHGRNLYELYEEARTPYEWHERIFRVAHDCGLICFSTPFDIEGVEFLASLDNPIYKIASFEIAHIPLIRAAAKQGKPMVLSTGIASAREIQEAVDACRQEGCHDITLLKCTSAYPARVEDAALGQMPILKERYGVKVGLSDHSPGSMLPVLSVAFGATMIEKHFIIDRNTGGPDAAFSMNVEEFSQMVKDVRIAEQAVSAAGGIPESESIERPGRQWGRSLYVAAPIKKGEPFTQENVACVRPGFSLHPRHLLTLLTLTADRDYQPGDRIIPEILTNQTNNLKKS